MSEILLLSIRAEAPAVEGVLHYGGKDLNAAVSFLEALPDGFHSLSVSLSGFDTAGQAHMLYRSTQHDEEAIMLLYEDVRDWLRDMGAAR